MSEKIWVRKKFWFNIFFGTNKIFRLKILGPKKFQIWKKIGVKKDNVEKKKFKAKINFGSGKFFRKKLWVQKKFYPQKSFKKFGSKNFWF